MADPAEPSTSASDVHTDEVGDSPLNPVNENVGSVNPTRLQRALAEARLFSANPDALRQLFQLGGGDANGVMASLDPYGSGGPASRTGPNPSLRDLLSGDSARVANALSTLRDGAVPPAPPRSDDTAAPSTSFQSIAPTVYPYDRSRRGLLGSRLSELPRFRGNPSEDKMSFGEWVEMYERLTRADRWSNEDRFDTLPALLRDTAYTIYKNVCRSTPNNYTDVIEAMKPFLRPSLGPEATFKKAYAMNQKSTQTVLDYATEIQHVLEQDGIIAPDEL